MNSKTLKKQRELKQKLMAAISMLLVSSLMMVTSTYAWFTLSTAPEVTGITTAVGANGNLEMALLNPTLQDTDGKLVSGWGDQIVSSTNDSMDAAGKLLSEANKTWGNLVDLQDNDTYGLNHISLYPSALNTDETGAISATPLSYPKFGADGRIAELAKDTLTASYTSGTFSNEGKYGVRAVGTASSMTAREMAHRAAMTSAATASTSAKAIASGTLQTNGNVLAGIAITHVGKEDATHSYTEVNALKTVLVDLKGALDQIGIAMKWYVVAENIAPNTVTDATFQAIQNEINANTLAEIAAADYKYSKPAGFEAAYTALTTSQKNVQTALDKVNQTLEGKGEADTFDWSAVSAPLNYIMDYNQMKLNGLKMEDVKKKDDDNNFVNAGTILQASQKEGLQLQMGQGSGVFADIADFCGTYSAAITFTDGTKVMGVNIGGMTATMITNDPEDPTYLASIRTATKAFAKADGVADTVSITDYYGYIIDLGFRTNAAGSDLLLQADAIDRIYGSEGKNEDTLGGGSTMTFKSAADGFNEGNIQALMGALRIVFFEPDTGNILGHARLNPATASIESGEVTMKMAMWDTTANDFRTGDEAKVITELTQNEAKAISVLVYLDGEAVKNKDVAATGSQSMIGSMNLQFASSAVLKAMDYSDLKDGKSSTDTSQTIDMTNVTVDDAAAAAGISVTKAVGTNDTGFGVILRGVSADSVVTASVNGGAAITGTPGAVSGLSGYAFAYTGTLAANTPIVITVTEAPASGT